MTTTHPAASNHQSTLVKALRACAGVIAGAMVGAMCNMGILIVGMVIVPAPEGVDLNKIETIAEHIDEYSFAQLMVPWFAHAGGTFIGALVATLTAGKGRGSLIAALCIGALFEVGGIMAVRMIPAPLWFNTLDLTLAYFPMAFLGWWLLRRTPR